MLPFLNEPHVADHDCGEDPQSSVLQQDAQDVVRRPEVREGRPDRRGLRVVRRRDPEARRDDEGEQRRGRQHLSLDRPAFFVSVYRYLKYRYTGSTVSDLFIPVCSTFPSSYCTIIKLLL